MTRKSAITRSTFGDVVLVAFLVLQALDGVLTYVGVRIYGLRIEGNPVMAWLMSSLGQGFALMLAKGTAGAFGIALHMSAVHRVVAVLAAFYLAIAIVPWIGTLYWAW